MDRIIALLDMDCFYVQVHQRAEPDTWGLPCAVVQYTGGGVIAANYEAREYGIKKQGFRIDQCYKECPAIRLFYVKELRGKADLTLYRNASAEVMSVLSSYDSRIIVERASIDEAYLDLTAFINAIEPGHKCFSQDIPNVHVAGITPPTVEHLQEILDPRTKAENERLIIAAKVMQQLKDEIKTKTGFSCSTGISRNKIMAKLACGFKKPNGLSIFPRDGLVEVWKKTPIKKVRNLGGKLGSILMEQFQVETMGDLAKINFDQLQAVIGSATKSQWVSDLLNGDEPELVSPRLIPKSVGCGKNFVGLNSLDDVKHWVTRLASELVERLTEDQKVNQRKAQSVVFSIRTSNHETNSKTFHLREYNVDVISNEIVRQVVNKLPLIPTNKERLEDKITSLYMTASKFVDEKVISKSAVHKTASLNTYFNSAQRTFMEASTSSEKTPPHTPVKSKTEICVLLDEDDDEHDNAEYEVIDIEDDQVPPKNSELPEAKKSEFVPKRGFFFRKTEELLKAKRRKVSI